MVGETCESIVLGRDTCGQPAHPCPVCHRAYCPDCYPGHKKEHKPVKAGLGPWRYDERTGMVAVYPGEEKNCLDLPADSFIYVRILERKAEGIGFQQVQEDKEIGKLVAAAPEMLEALKDVQAIRRSASGPDARGDKLTWTEVQKRVDAAIARAERI